MQIACYKSSRFEKKSKAFQPFNSNDYHNITLLNFNSAFIEMSRFAKEGRY